MEQMTPRERMLTAMRNGTPDRVPVAPDISNMIPSRLTGKPFWSIYAEDDPPLGDAYIEACRTFGLDGWYTYGRLDDSFPVALNWRYEFLEKSPEKWVRRTVVETPAGDLSEVTWFPVDNPPTTTEKMIKNVAQDIDKYKYLLQVPVTYDADRFRQQKKRWASGVSCAHPSIRRVFMSGAAPSTGAWKRPPMPSTMNRSCSKSCVSFRRNRR